MTSACVEVLRIDARCIARLAQSITTMSSARYTFFTIRYLTRFLWLLRSGMQIVKIKRTVRTNNCGKFPAKHRFLQFAQNFFDNENHFEFIIEAVLFGALLAVSAWPIIAAAGAINEILRIAA